MWPFTRKPKPPKEPWCKIETKKLICITMVSGEEYWSSADGLKFLEDRINGINGDPGLVHIDHFEIAWRYQRPGSVHSPCEVAFEEHDGVVIHAGHVESIAGPIMKPVFDDGDDEDEAAA